MENEERDRDLARIVNWDILMAAVEKDQAYFWSLVHRHEASSSKYVASALIGVINHCRRERRIDSGRALQALIHFTQSLDVWGMKHWIAPGLLNSLYCAILEDGLQPDAEILALAMFLREAAARFETFIGPAFDLQVEVINVCYGLAYRRQLVSVLDSSPGIRSYLLDRIESAVEAMARDDQELLNSYAKEAQVAIDALRLG